MSSAAMDIFDMNQFHFPHQHFDQRSQHHFTDTTNMRRYSMPQTTSSVAAMPNLTKTNETKPRLGKEEVDRLEREFQKNPKPTTQTKRGFAEDMSVDLARINNWFQNRRAKRKQEKKQEAYEAAQAKEALGYSEPSSPDYYTNQGFAEEHILPQQSQPSLSGPPPPLASYNPQYTDPTGASIESLQRTMAAAQAAVHQTDFHHGFGDQSGGLDFYGDPLVILGSSHVNRAQFPSNNDSLGHFDTASSSFNYGHAISENQYNASIGSIRSSVSPTGHHARQFNTCPPSSDSDPNGAQLMAGLPPQVLHSQSHDGLPYHQQERMDSHSPENSQSPPDIKYELAENDTLSPPASTGLFKSPPPPTDLAARRKKVQNKPAALFPNPMRGRPSSGPRTVSQAEGFKRTIASPLTSPMRRIASAGGNRNVLTGRVQKSGIESAQRSPINLQGFPEIGFYMNDQKARVPPSLTAGSSLYSSLAPPTPMSPRDGSEACGSSASPPELGLSFPFNTGVSGCFSSMEPPQNLASPPETPQAQLSFQSSNTWINTSESKDGQWSYDVPDEPQFTPAQDNFPTELYMPQPSYLSSASQPVTPAFGQFNLGALFEVDSPHIRTGSPHFMVSNHRQSDYTFPEAQSPYSLGSVGMADALAKQKKFQFSNTTFADFTEK